MLSPETQNYTCLGLTTADYESNRSDGDMASALNFACSLIKKEISKLGLINVNNLLVNKKSTTNLSLKELNETDFALLKILLTTYTENPEGYSLWTIKNEMNIDKILIDFSSIKLEKIGFIQKENISDYNNNFYYSYTITQDGIEYLLQNEAKIYFSIKPTVSKNTDKENPF